jgi:hypothetical protein
VPARYLYPTHHGRLNRLSNLLAVPWATALIWLLVRLPEQRVDGRFADEGTRQLALASLAYPAFYLLVSWGISVRIFARARRIRRADGRQPAAG